jgi:TnpA family transposase
MPVRFLSPAHYQTYGQYHGAPSQAQLSRYFFLDDFDQAQIKQRRRDSNRLGLALQLVTVRFLGTFVKDLTAIPQPIIGYVARQLSVDETVENLKVYNDSETFWDHQQLIGQVYGYRDFYDPEMSFIFLRWLYTRTWIGSERPSVLFDLSTAWLMDHKILLPGVTVLERLVAQIRERAERRSWHLLNTQLTPQQQTQLQHLIASQDENGVTLDDLRRMPTHVSSPQINHTLQRLETIRELGLHSLEISHISANRLRTLADYALTAVTRTLKRLQPERQTAVLLAGIHLLAVRTQDLVLDMFEQWWNDAITQSKNTVEQKRLRTLAAYDQAAFYLRDLAQFIVEALPEDRAAILDHFAVRDIQAAIAIIDEVKQPELQGYHGVLIRRYRSVRRFLPAFLRLIEFQGVPEADHVLDALHFLRRLDAESNLSLQDAPRSVISTTWRGFVYNQNGDLEREPYTLSVLHEFYQRLRRRDIFVMPSERWHDPRQFLLNDSHWQKLRPQICRMLDRNVTAENELDSLSKQLDEEYHQTRDVLAANADLRLEMVDGYLRPVVTPLDALPETPQLQFLQQRLTGRLPAIDLPQLMLDVHHLTGFADAFTHISEQQSRITDFPISLCAVLLAQGCNIGLEAVVDEHIPALTHERLRWVEQNHVRPDTLVEASNWLVAAQSQIPLAQHWGGGQVASADGLRFVVPQRALHGRFNRKYFGTGRGVTFFNFLSDQFTGFHHVVIPGTLREALYILDGLLDQTTPLRPKEVMTDTHSYTDVVFGLFWLLGFQFSPRLADIKHRRFWRMDRQADYGTLNPIARACINVKRVAADWDDMLRVAGSLHTGAVSASHLMRIFSTSGHTPSLIKSIRDVGRIAKTCHMLHYIRDAAYQRHILIQLNHTELRHKLARRLMYGNRGELKHAYREGQEMQLGALGLLLNIVVYWNTVYLDRALTELLATGADVDDDALNRITPLAYDHIRILGRYTFTSPHDTHSPIYRPLKPMPLG